MEEKDWDDQKTHVEIKNCTLSRITGEHEDVNDEIKEYVEYVLKKLKNEAYLYVLLVKFGNFASLKKFTGLISLGPWMIHLKNWKVHLILLVIW